MLDLHTHILPRIDDGSRDVEESIALLSMLKAQGVTRVAATPHFEARGDTPEEFLARRNSAYAELLSAAKDMDFPKVFLGAEISYFYGFSHMECLSALRIEGTRLLLIEMPMEKWTDAMVNELVSLAAFREYKPVLAHIERYFPFATRRQLTRLRENGVLFQINASFVSDKRMRRAAIRFIRRGNVHFLGSDCHRLSFRPPNISEAGEIIISKLGQSFLSSCDVLFDKYII